jgi:hypothetical protein
MALSKIERGEEAAARYFEKYEYTPGHYPGIEVMDTGDIEVFLGDLVADLMHYADHMDISFDAVIDRATMHYTEERANPPVFGDPDWDEEAEEQRLNEAHRAEGSEA